MAETLLTRQHDGQSLTVHVGSRLSVRLDESPTTGHHWVDRSDGDAVVPAGDEFIPPASGAVGAGGAHIFRYSVSKPGAAHLSLLLKQPWADDASAAERWAVTVQAIA
jgi:predicted secreted protein